jgi:predicted unusual protein kinase regulating ubiquinone biosynthesis (AarF/ABC1/UbiB family)
VPQPYPQLCSKHLLVMECLDGVKLVDGVRAQYSKLAKLRGTTLEVQSMLSPFSIAVG